mgnify:CR=1 FL=1
MKLLLENWRKYLAEATTIPRELKQGIRDAIINSQFWTHPHTEDEVDEVRENELGTPAAEVLMDALNNAAQELGTDLHFVITVDGTGEYILGPGDPHGNYPNNWTMQGQYRGPENDKHIVWIELQPLSEDYHINDLDPEELSGILSRTINHELVHYEQLKKQAQSKGISDDEAWKEMMADPRQFSKSGKRADYLTRHIEVDAFAHEAAEQLLSIYSPDEAHDLIKKRSPELKGVVRDYLNVLGDNPNELKKFWSKLYTQLGRQNEANP